MFNKKNIGDKGMNKYKTEHYKNPVLNVEEFMSEHYDKNINNQIEGAVTECILCGKGIKAHSKHYDVVSGCGNYGQLIHKDDWKFADSISVIRNTASRNFRKKICIEAME